LNSQPREASGAAKRFAGWTLWQRNYVLAVLCVVAVFNYIDRQIMTILLQPIKEDFGASDTIMGLLVSTIFAVFYLVAAIPVARLADRYPRKAVLAACLAFWSAMTSLGAVAANVFQLALTRIGVAVAEAGAVPASHSIISDLYSVQSRGRAIAVISSAQSLGIGLGVFLGGWLSDSFGWRTSFLIVGLPGLALVALFLLTTREPARGLADQVTDIGETPRLGATFAALWKVPTYRCLVLVSGLCGFCGYGTLNWGPTFLRRMHEMSGTDVGIWFGSAVAFSLVAGNMLGGILGDWLGKRDLRAYMWVAGAGPLLSFPFGLTFVLAPTWPLAIFGLSMFMLLLTFHIPTCYAMGQTLAPLRMRAMASVIIGLASGLMGMMLAPVTIGAINDVLALRFGDGSIRYALVFAISFCLLGSATAFVGARWIRADVAHART